MLPLLQQLFTQNNLFYSNELLYENICLTWTQMLYSSFSTTFLCGFYLFLWIHGRSRLPSFVSVFRNSLRHTHCSKKPTLILLFQLSLALNILPSIYFTLIIILCDTSQTMCCTLCIHIVVILHPHIHHQCVGLGSYFFTQGFLD